MGKWKETALSMPNSLQYPLERERELQRRWNRLLQRTVEPKAHSVGYLDQRHPSVIRFSNSANSTRLAASREAGSVAAWLGKAIDEAGAD
jgi:hypothetical protein